MLTHEQEIAALRAEKERLRRVVDAAREIPPAWRAEIAARVGNDDNAKIAAIATIVLATRRLDDALAALDAGKEER